MVTMFEKAGRQRSAAGYKENVQKLETMKRRLIELKDLDLEKPMQDARKKASELGYAECTEFWLESPSTRPN